MQTVQQKTKRGITYEMVDRISPQVSSKRKHWSTKEELRSEKSGNVMLRLSYTVEVPQKEGVDHPQEDSTHSDCAPRMEDVTVSRASPSPGGNTGGLLPVPPCLVGDLPNVSTSDPPPPVVPLLPAYEAETVSPCESVELSPEPDTELQVPDVGWDDELVLDYIEDVQEDEVVSAVHSQQVPPEDDSLLTLVSAPRRQPGPGRCERGTCRPTCGPRGSPVLGQWSHYIPQCILHVRQRYHPHQW